MKWLKFIAALCALLIIAGLLAIGGFLLLSDPEQFKKAIVEEIQQKTGYQLTIDGPLHWVWIPRFALKADHIILREPANDTILLEAKAVSLSANFLTALQHQDTFEGNVQMAGLRFMRLPMQDVAADVNWQKTTLKLNHFSANLYQGNIHGDLLVQDLRSAPYWRWHISLINIPIKPLLADAAGKENRLQLSGLMNFNMAAEAQGKNRAAFINQLYGKGDFTINNGEIESIDFDYFINAAQALIKKNKNENELINQHRTHFDSLTGSFTINHGVAETKNTILSAPTLSVLVKGRYELLRKLLDFQLLIRPELAEEMNWQVPVVLTGTLAQPEINLNLMNLQRVLTAEHVKKAKQKALEKIEKHVHGKAGEFLKKLLR